MNTKVCYLYRDADNYKMYNECVINGLLNETQKAKILDCLHDSEFFVPNKVGLPEKRFDRWDDEVDHIWFELDEESFEETEAPANVSVTPEELVKSFEFNKGRWENVELQDKNEFAAGKKVAIFHDVDEDIIRLDNTIKYWTNACGDILIDAELPSPLQRAYDELWGEIYGSYCCLVETPDGYGVALIYEYDRCFADDCGMSMEELFYTVCEDADIISGHPEFKNAKIYVGEQSGFDRCHDLTVVFPANTPTEEFQKAAEVLDELAYETAKTQAGDRPVVADPPQADETASLNEARDEENAVEYVMLSFDKNEIEQLGRATGFDVRTIEDLRDAVMFAIEKYVETYLPATDNSEIEETQSIEDPPELIPEENGVFDDIKAVFSSVYWLDDTTLLYEFGSYVDDEGDEYDVNCEYHADDNSWHLLKRYDGDILPMSLDELPAEQKLRIMGKMIREGGLDESVANISAEEKFENATFVSVWDGGYCVETACKVNRLTGEVTDIEISEGSADFVNELDEEFIRMADGREYPVSNDKAENGFWYDADEPELEDASLDAKIQAASDKARRERADDTALAAAMKPMR